MSGENAIEKAVREPVLSPVDRVSELLFGSFMAHTFVGAVSVAEAGVQPRIARPGFRRFDRPDVLSNACTAEY
jgi:hypothetical protein